MPSPSSTFSSDVVIEGARQEGAGPGFPWALVVALAIACAIEIAVSAAAPRFLDTVPLLYRLKLERARTGPAEDVIVLGDSQSVVTMPPRELERFLPPGTRVFNFGIPAAGPTGGELLLRTYLERHPPPRLTIVGYSAEILNDNPDRFTGYEVKHLLGGGRVLREAWLSRRPDYVSAWVQTRVPSFRVREDLRSFGTTLLLDRWPGLQPRLHHALGGIDHPFDWFRFRWYYTQRSERNAGIERDLETELGWRYWREMSITRTETLPDGVSFKKRPFHPGPTEARGLRDLFALAREAGASVLVLPLPLPERRVGAIEADGGRERIDRMWRDAIDGSERVATTGRWLLPLPNHYFSDDKHVNRAGSARFVEEMGPVIRDAFARTGASGVTP